MKKIFNSVLSVVLSVVSLVSLCSCGNNAKIDYIGDVYIYNFGDYMAEEAIDIFEQETRIRVHQDVFEANEEALPVVESGAKYDVICISDYMIEKMLDKGLLRELDLSKIPNYENINKGKLKMLSVCDPGNKVAVPYFWGTMGIVFNKKMLDDLGVPYPTSWSDLWNPKLRGELLMQSSLRDLYTVGLMKNGFSPNSQVKEEIDKATEDFIAQKPFVQAYMVDQIKDKMILEEAAIAPITSGDVQYIYNEGDIEDGNIGFIIPKEGTCPFIDAWCILKNSENVDNAYKFIDYMCREDVARINADYVGYESVNDKTPDEEFLQMRMIPDVYFDYSTDDKKILERDVEDAVRYYNDGYNRLKAS